MYNTLRSLTERGFVRELPFDDATRFDVNVEPHANLVFNARLAMHRYYLKAILR